MFSINIIGEKPIICYWEIHSQLSGKKVELQIKGKKIKIINKIPFGNCVVNHFYHCFEKYPLLGALPYYYKKYEKNSLEISFFVEQNYFNKLKDIINYLDELKKICEVKKNISFGDINLNFINNKNKFNFNIEKETSSIGHLLIKLLEITPIQIAKILEKQFNIMSDGENIEKKLNEEIEKRKIFKKDTKINIIEYSNLINLCIKDSIFNYYEIPVIVICCFGTQSAGKSTFLNELIGSLFNVSGMRCTEGI